MKPSIREIVESISGLEPGAALVLAPGFVREEWKSLCFKSGKAIVENAILSPKQIAQILVPESQDQMIERFSRIEMLRENFKAPELRSALPKLLEHRFRPKFFESLDRALQKGRELFVHAEEARIFEERLNEKNGLDERRSEFFGLNRFWERLLELRGFHDDASLFEAATRRLREEGGSRIPFQKLFWLDHFGMSPRIRHFFEELSRSISVEHLHSSGFFQGRESIGSSPALRLLNRKLTHSLEDGAHHLLDEVLRDPDHEVVVIEDRPEIRRTLERIALERGVNLQDARDPTLLTQSEEMKTALLELDLVSRNFSRDLALAWINAKDPDRGDLRRQIIESNAEPKGNPAFKPLLERYPKKMTVEQLGEAILESASDFRLPEWVSKVLAATVEEWKLGLRKIGSERKPRPLQLLSRELGDRLKTAAPPVPPVRRESGLHLYRVDQAVSFALPPGVRVHFFGVSPAFFEPKEDGTEWLSGRDLETLAFEFALPDRKTRRETSRNSLLSWVNCSSHPPVFWEFEYDEGGTEVESAALVLSSFPELELPEPAILHVHEKVLRSFSTTLKPPRTVAEVPLEGTEFPMGFLNSLGNCPFTAFAQHLLRLYDERDPDFELGSDVYGNLLHAAIEILLVSPKPDAELAFEEAWKKTRKPAWLRSERLHRSMRARALTILETFLGSESEYRNRSGAEPKLQEAEIELKREGLVFRGRMDRVDQHADGLVVLDYKTSAKQPSGQVSLEKGKGLQLASYALALRDQENQEVVSAQYVVLSPEKINRNYGVLFKKWNQGKASDSVEFPLSFVKSNHTSLFDAEPDELWKAFDSKITGLIRKAQESGFRAEPADPQDCKSCRYSGVCGRERAVLP
ncbi:MAG: PD-(D/E)XK nuclease family protein [Bdellovibrionales bacterium]|nr:PD-(D/E)XK nuclease family protein [Bdellovibrionales bacterium]